MRKLALSGLALGAAMGIGTAQAEPLTLSEAEMDNVTAGGFFFFDVFATKFVDKDINLEVEKDIDAFALLFGNIGDAEAAAQSFGPNTLAETLTIANADYFSGFSDAFSQSLAAANRDVFTNGDNGNGDNGD